MKRQRLLIAFASAILSAALATAAFAQYQPIPNFSGATAGAKFRQAINDRFSGVQPISPTIVQLSYAQLAATPEVEGAILFCTGCSATPVCAAGSQKLYVFGAGGVWNCGIAALGTLGGDVTGPAGSNTANTVLGGKTPLVSGASGVTLNGLAGAKTDGSDNLTGFSVNGVKNVKAFGALGSVTTANATTVSGNAVVTLNAIGDFAIGQWVQIDHAGVNSTASTPTALAVAPNTYTNNPNPRSLVEIAGCTTDAQAAAQGHNTGCAQTYTYQVTGVAADGSWSAPTATISTAVGPTTISTNNNIRVTWTGAGADVAYLVWACNTGGTQGYGSCPTMTLHAVVPHFEAPGAVAQSRYRDFGKQTGRDQTYGVTFQAGAVAANLFAQITSVSGTTVTLTGAPSQTGTFAMRHDDSVAINNAIATLCTHTGSGNAGGQVFFPSTAGYPIGQTINLYLCTGLALTGPTESGDYAKLPNLDWHGAIGGTLLNMNQTADVRVSSLSMVQSNSDNTAGRLIDIDLYDAGGGLLIATQHDIFEHLNLGNAGNPISLSNRNVTGNAQNLRFDDVQITQNPNGQGNQWGYAVTAGGGQSYNEVIKGGLVQSCAVGILSDFVGQLHLEDTNFELNIVDLWTHNRFGGAADGFIELHGTTHESAQYLIYTEDGGANSNWILRNVRAYLTPGPNGFVIQTGLDISVTDSYIGAAGVFAAKIAARNTYSVHNQYSDPNQIPFISGSGSGSSATESFYECDDWVNNATVSSGCGPHTRVVEICSDNGTVTTNQSVSFSANSCQKYSTSTTGLTYTLSTTNVQTDRTVTLESYITGAIAAGPLWATSSGAIKWTGGAAPVSSATSGYTDILRLKWDGANWQEISRAMGNH